MDSIDQLATSDLLRRAASLAREDADGDGEARWEAVAALRRRVEPAVFQQAVEWCASDAPRERWLGADILAQLGAPAFPFSTDSTPILIGLLRDKEEQVVVKALYALGHLGAGSVPKLTAFAGHASADVRLAATHALVRREEPAALDILRVLSRDPDRDVRDWATFGLGSLSERDTPQIRSALAARLDDDDDEIRWEAMVGLARRGDQRVTAAVAQALQAGDVSWQVIEAVTLRPSPAFVAPLERLWEVAPREEIRRALESCRAASASPTA